MALLIKPTVTYNGLSREGCYMQLVPHFTTGSTTVPTDRNIWADKSDYDANPTNGTIPALKEISTAFYVDINSAPKDCEGDTVAIKMLYWINEAIKSQILADNPTWVDSDIDIVDLPA